MKIMTKQEEIREGIIKRLNEFRWELQKPNALISVGTLIILQGAFADQILKDEDSQGVVIKVEREKPHNAIMYSNDGEYQAYDDGRNIILESGYSAFEPLIKKEDGL